MSFHPPVNVDPSIIDDPTIGMLTDDNFRTYIELLALYSMYGKEGGNTNLSEDQIAWRLRRTVTDSLNALLNLELISFDDNGSVVVCTLWTYGEGL